MLGGVVVDDAGVFNTKLQEWEDFYNYHRPNGSLGGQTPYERLRQKVGGSSVSGHRHVHTLRTTEGNHGLGADSRGSECDLLW
jgi:hypothetical protein